MASEQYQPLVTVGPFTGLNSRSAEAFMGPAEGVSVSNTDTHHKTGGLSSAPGRTPFLQFNLLGAAAKIKTLFDFLPFPKNIYTIAQSDSALTSYYRNDQDTGQISTIVTPFDQVVQFQDTMFLNNGQQIYLGTDGFIHAAQWQYAMPDTAIYNYKITDQPSNPGNSLAPAVYQYAFVQVVTLPAGGVQSTSANGVTPISKTSGILPFQITSTGNDAVQITGQFSGTFPDGSTYVTKVYRQSSNQPTFQLLAILTTSPYTDFATDLSIAGNEQLVVNLQFQDSPPASGANLSHIEAHQNRMWCLAHVNNKDTNNTPQTQLWFSLPGIPWSFSKTSQVLLVDDATTSRQNTANVAYDGFDDHAVNLVRVGSNLILFKANTIWAVDGRDQSNYDLVQLFTIGCISKRSVTKANGVVFWLSNEGAYMFDGGSGLQYISEPIFNELESITQAYGITALQNSTGFFADLCWILSFPDANISYVYHTITKAWNTLPYATNAAYFNEAMLATGKAGSKINQIIAVRPNTNKVDTWLSDPGQDLGVPPVCVWKSSLQDGGNVDTEKQYRFVRVYAPTQPGIVNVFVEVDPGSPTGTSQSFKFDLSKGPRGTYAAIADQGMKGFNAQITVTFSPVKGATGPVVIYSVKVLGVNTKVLPLPA